MGIARVLRKTNDRIRDLDEKNRSKVLNWMQSNELPSDLVDPVRMTLPLARQDQKAMFGESLPSGIILKE